MMQTPYTTSTQGQYCHPCGMFHHHNQSCNYNNNNNNSNAGSYSMMFSMHNGGVFEQNGGEDYYSSSVVDCTLSLGTPSTRLCEEDEKRRLSTSSGASSCISNFWDLLHTKNNSSKTVPYSSNVQPFSTNKPTRGWSGGASGCGGDSLLARRCANCDTTSTPLWRNGPRGPKNICSPYATHAAFVSRKKKEELTAASGNVVAGAAPHVSTDHQYGNHNSGYNNYNTATNNNGTSSWVHHTSQRVPCNYPANEIRFMDDCNGGNNGDSDVAHGGVPLLSWKLNVADRASLVHDFTR